MFDRKVKLTPRLFIWIGIITVSIVMSIYTYITYDPTYKFPIMTVDEHGTDIQRIYQQVSMYEVDKIPPELTFERAKSLMDKHNLGPDMFKGYSFGKIDYYVKDNVYKVYDTYGNNYLNIFVNKDELNRVVGISYIYMKSDKDTKFPDNEYIKYDLTRLDSLLSINYDSELLSPTAKAYNVKHSSFSFMSVVVHANNAHNDSIYKTFLDSSDFSLTIALFMNEDNYNKFKDYLK